MKSNDKINSGDRKGEVKRNSGVSELSFEELEMIRGGEGTKKVSVAGTTDTEEARRRIEAYLNAMRGA